ncbi:hypothetical protein BX600DRAFT_444577 [Xylariales sp. PMI_506]|nr:hypothetical protein BX600DRAFT_444577 [Xylariales sp. PMI_506]
MSTTIKKVAIFGASGNFGKPITTALRAAGFQITIITRPSSTVTPPADDITVLPIGYDDPEALTVALRGHDAAVSVVGPGAINSALTMVEAAAAAGVRRYIINDFGWGPDFRSEPEFAPIGGQRQLTWARARDLAALPESGFTWTGITIGNPIDWALKRFPPMGFNVAERSAMIYDDGTEEFTGTTLAGIGQSVVGVLQHPEETANRFVKVRSIKTSQNALLDAFQRATDQQWQVTHSNTAAKLESGRRKHREGAGGWVLDLLVYQLFQPGQARCVVAPTREASDSPLLGVVEETPDEVVAKALAA